VNTYHKIFPTKTNIPFGGTVYPADLVAKTARLEREVARQKQALEEKERLIKELTDANAQYDATSDDEEGVDDEQDQNALEESEELMTELANKQARIDELDRQRRIESERLAMQNAEIAGVRESMRNLMKKYDLSEDQILRGQEQVKLAAPRKSQPGKKLSMQEMRTFYAKM
jgi:DNA repair exonuclease SbcCD ATPase subunit